LNSYPLTDEPSNPDRPASSAHAALDNTEHHFRIIPTAQRKPAPETKPSKPALSERMADNLRPAAERIDSFWRTLTERASESWGQMPGPHRAIVLVCAAVGLATGVITGLALPGWAAAMVTSMFGAAVWMPCLVWLSNALGAPWRALFDRSPAQWLAAWAIAAVIGLIAQRRFARRRTAAAAPGA
jgi:hypothetical protein